MSEEKFEEIADLDMADGSECEGSSGSGEGSSEEDEGQDFLNVEQGECEAVFKRGKLITHGVGPCIAVIAQGLITYEDNNQASRTQKFISLYHSQDELYRLYCMSVDERPVLAELSPQYLPMLIKHGQQLWVYGLDANQKPQLTGFTPSDNEAYSELVFNSEPKAFDINEVIYNEIGQAKAHCHYFHANEQEKIEQEANFNYCVELIKTELIENFFGKICSDFDAKRNVKILNITLHHLELIGGQKADSSTGLSGSEMKALAFKKNFESKDTLNKLANALEADTNVILEVPALRLSTDKLLQLEGEKSFDVSATFSEDTDQVEIQTAIIGNQAPELVAQPPHQTSEPISPGKGYKRILEDRTEKENHKKARCNPENEDDLEKSTLNVIPISGTGAYQSPFFACSKSFQGATQKSPSKGNKENQTNRNNTAYNG